MYRCWLAPYRKHLLAEVRKLAAALLARHNGQEAEACRHLFSRLAIALQRGKSANRIPTFPDPQTNTSHCSLFKWWRRSGPAWPNVQPNYIV
jgi:hypothetical protein